MAIINPIRLLYDFLLSSNEHIYGTHPVILVRASTDASERNDTVVDDNPDLWVWNGRARQN